MRRMAAIVGAAVIAGVLGLLLIIGVAADGVSGCEIVSLEHGSFFAMQNKEQGEGACIEIRPQNDGVLRIEAGWAFTSPVTMDGEIIPTEFVEGEMAPQIVPLTKKLFAGETQVIQASPMPSGSSELGLWGSLEEERVECEQLVITETMESSLVTASLSETVSGACIEVRAETEVEGELRIEAGWAFTSPVTMDGEILPVDFVEGEAAPQIVPFTKTVRAGEEAIFKASPMPDKTSELGMWVAFFEPDPPEPPDPPDPPDPPEPPEPPEPPQQLTVFLPLVRKDPPTLREERVYRGGLEVVGASWQGAVDGQTTCLIIHFDSRKDGEILRGWITEKSPIARLNGEPFQLQVFHDAEEDLPQIKGVGITAPEHLEICLFEGTNREIGLVLNQ